MTSVGAFNDMMEQFINELVTTFPEEKGIKKYQASFEMVRKANPRKCVESFMAAIAPYANRITTKDESIMKEDISFLNQVNITKYWTPELSQNTKDAIWQYLQTLYMLGMTISSIPADTLNMIENVASQCADKIQSGDGQLDEKALMSSVSGLLGNIGGMFGGQTDQK
jgi:hypothetical protein